MQALKKEGSDEKRCRKWNTRYYEVTVNYEGVGDAKLYLCRFPYQKDWRVFLSTNTSLKFADMMKIYSISLHKQRFWNREKCLDISGV